jgi:4-amino-4-deoxychorismate lyase
MDDFPLLLETIRIENGRPLHLEWHDRRFNRARRELFGAREALDLADHLGELPPTGVYRCRLLYTLYIEKIEFLPYIRRLPRSFALAEFDGDYRYKYADRGAFERLRALRPDVEELILCREGLLTDTTVANIALRRGETWYTPRRPLLEGTTRARLLEEGKVIEADIPCNAIAGYDELALMNAMIGFAPVDEPIYNVRGKDDAP